VNWVLTTLNFILYIMDALLVAMVVADGGNVGFLSLRIDVSLLKA
jgi:hypothetical protein